MSRPAAGANTYGFDFLKTEHTLSSTGAEPGSELHQPPAASSAAHPFAPTPVAPDAGKKSDLEKQFDVLHFLQAHRSSGCLPPSVIYKSIGIDLSADGADEDVAKMLLRNPKVRIEEVPDPENPSLSILTYGYQAKFNNIRNKVGLLAQINRCKNGVASRDLTDAYDGVEDDLTALITAGDVLAVTNPEAKDRILFPRGEAFLVELDGSVTVADLGLEEEGGGGDAKATAAAGETKDDAVLAAIKRARMETARRLAKERTCVIDVDVDPRKQIRRGEAVCVGGQWFRVSSAIREGVPLSEQPPRAQAPPSVTLRKDLSKKNEVDGYVRPFDDRRFPVDSPLSDDALRNLRDAKKAKELLHRIAGKAKGVSGGAAAQLLSSNATAANPSSLAASFASAAAASAHGGAGGGRKRPAGKGGHHHHPPGGAGAGGAHPSHHPNAAGGGGGGATSMTPAQAMEQAKRAASDPALTYAHARRHGCTKDVRELYLSTRADVPESETELYNLMLQHKLIEPGEAMRRPRMKKKANVDNDGKPKKRRYYERKNQRMTNTHLLGTEIGAALARAAEKQQQGKAVGDGGM